MMVCMSAATPTIEATNPFSNHRVNNRRPRVVLLLVLLRRPARAVARLQHSCRVTRQQQSCGRFRLAGAFYRGRGFCAGSEGSYSPAGLCGGFWTPFAAGARMDAALLRECPGFNGTRPRRGLLAEPSSPTRLIS
jgi:hypothetical protein